MDFFVTLFSFALTIGIIVTVHEFGHFWVAKKSGVKVLRFSIGFGKILKSWKKGDTTYTICALPFGGFVKMLDEREGDVDKKDLPYAFNQQSVYKRIAIAAAGPMANFIFAIFAYTATYIIGIDGIRAIVGKVEPNSIAYHSGIKEKDKFLSINNSTTLSTQSVVEKLLEASFNKQVFIELESQDKIKKQLILNLPENWTNNIDENLIKDLGIKFAKPILKPVIDEVLINSPAYNSGLIKGDLITKINGLKIKSWSDLASIVQKNANNKLTFNILRGENTYSLNITPKLDKDSNLAKIGALVFVPKNWLDDWKVIDKHSFFESFTLAIEKTYKISTLTLKMLVNIFKGKVSTKHISGPITIANYAGQSFNIGLVTFISFLALISVSLAVLNLLPIPVLDGGHLLFYVIEIIKGSPLKDSVQVIASKIGLLIILILMSIAVYNDILNSLKY